MNFALSEEQTAIRELARRFARERLLPQYKESERTEVANRGLVREMGELGMLCPLVPAAYGGGGQSALTYGLILEALAYGDHALTWVNLLNSLISEILIKHASRELVARWVPRIASGELLAALALSEPEAGSDAAHIKLRAARHGDTYVLNGEKTSISLADQADVMVAFARTDPAQSGARGISAFFLPTELPGITRTHFNDLGSRVIGRGSIFFEEVQVPAANLLGAEGKGFTQVMQGFDLNRALIGLQCIGTAQASVDETWSYATARKAFGSPIIRFEGVSFPLAEAETWLEAGRQLCYRTLWLRDSGQPHTAESAMCKWWPPKVACEIIKECLLLHGHAGYSDDFPHGQRLRDVMGLLIGDGTEQVMKLIIAREKVGRVAVPY